jgi:chitin synthase
MSMSMGMGMGNMGMMPPPGYQSGRNTPQSFHGGMVYQPTPSRPTTNYLDIPIPTAHSPEDNDGLPSEFELDRAIQDILRTADLNSVTKREIRRQLEDRFGVDLTPRKAVINASIDKALLNA